MPILTVHRGVEMARYRARFRAKLAARVLPVVLAGFVVSTGLAVTSASQAQNVEVAGRGQQITDNAAQVVDGQTRAAQQAVTSLGAMASGFTGTDRTVLSDQVRALARATTGVSDAYLVYLRDLAPGADRDWAGRPGMTESGRFSLCWLREGAAAPQLAPYDDPTTDAAVTQPWFTGPQTTGRLTTAEPYVDPGSHVLMTSFTYPVTDATGRVVGVAGVDVPLDDLSSRIAETRVGQHGYAVLLSAQGTVLAVPRAKVDGRQVVGAASLQGAVPAADTAAAQAVVRRLARSRTGSMTARDPFGSQDALITWTEVPATGWTLVTVLPSREIQAPVVALRNKLALTAGLVVLAVGAALVVAAARLTRRLPVVRDAALRIAAGRLDVDLPEPQDDELGEVSTAFAAIVAYLRGAVEQETRFAEVQALADADGLTGIANRRRFHELARPLVRRAQHDRSPLVAVMADIDHFKAINDEYGHATGDDVIRAVSDRLSAVLRTGDTLCRYGGEEFAAVLPGTPPDVVHEFLERLRASVSDSPVATRSGDVNVTISVGAAHLRAEDDDLGAVLDRADAALYRAKVQGRNRVVSGAA